mmetsp:Transcript_9649/g.17328  ORF Transcript_9649/g.17328 Transcript_9649/m.17328 type:complete len:177 (+) Transcript_9649:58-588(+)
MALLRVKELPHVLGQLTEARPMPALPGGAPQGRVLGAMLMSRHGALLGSSGFDAVEFEAPDAVHPSPKVMSAIVSNIWAEYAVGNAAAHDNTNNSDGGVVSAAMDDGASGEEGAAGSFQTLLLELQHGHLAVVGICGGDYLLCAYADDKLQPGLLRIKIGSLAGYLNESLRHLPRC